VGLGPGNAGLLTRRAWQILEQAETVYLRTARHPAVSELPNKHRYTTFDAIYEEAGDFSTVYGRIAAELIHAAQDGQAVIYAVPGDPGVGEATVAAAIEGAARAGIRVTIVPGVSFVEPTLAALGRDALDGLQLFDAISVAGYNHPPVNPDFPLLLGQVYNRLLANDLKLSLMAVYPDDHQVTLVHGAGTAQQHLESIPLYEIDRSDNIGPLTSLFVPPLPTPSSLQALAEASAVLRSPDGCPWDREQTPRSLRTGFLEEVGEVLEALDNGDAKSLEEELGDVLFHLVMQAQMAREEELFRLSDVVSGIYSKIKRRHPHVWGDVEVQDSDEVVANWEEIKAGEKVSKAPESLLDGIPLTLPALARSQKIQGRVKRVGFDWPVVEGVVAKVQEELEELRQADDPLQQSAEMGDVLFAVVNLARWLHVDAESALREANARFIARFRLLEKLASDRRIELAQADLDVLEQLWQEAKMLFAQEREG
jgi:tetrapyrrole methylase family protein/MazG family protein